MHIDDLAALLDRYRKHQCTSEEQQIIEAWYKSLEAGPSLPGEEAVNASLDNVFARLEASLTAPGTPHSDEPVSDDPPLFEGSSGRRPYIRIRRMLAAAAVLLLVGVSFWAYRTQHRLQMSSDRQDSIWVSTVSGETKKMVLPDGSVIQLNANSRLGYLRAFTGTNRDVNLETGEAFFQVASDAHRPFIVHAGGLHTTVLGTSFNIRSFGRDNGTAIALVSGKVSVRIPSQSQPLVLTPHTLLTYDNNSGQTDTSRFERETDIAAWKQRAMNFRDASFDDIAFEVDNMYNIQMLNASSRRHWSYTGYFAGESIWEVVKTLCITEDLDYRFEQGHIIIINKK
jgi:transmembrane sensor